jgi:hypothetical protein
MGMESEIKRGEGRPWSSAKRVGGSRKGYKREVAERVRLMDCACNVMARWIEVWGDLVVHSIQNVHPDLPTLTIDYYYK